MRLTNISEDSIEAWLCWEGSGHVIESRPDQDERYLPAIDAIAGPYAIEQTSIDSYKDQRKSDDRLKGLTRNLETKFGPEIGFRLIISIATKTLSMRRDWSQQQKALCNWLQGPQTELEWEVPVQIDAISELPFLAQKTSRGMYGVKFYRFDPSGQKPTAHLSAKLAKLAKWKNKKRTVLIVESRDNALMSPQRALEVLSTELEKFNGHLPGQTWFVHWDSDVLLNLHEIVQSRSGDTFALGQFHTLRHKPTGWKLCLG